MKTLTIAFATLALLYGAPAAYADCDTACAAAVHAAKDTLNSNLATIKAINQQFKSNVAAGTNIHSKAEMKCFNKSLKNAAKSAYKDAVKAAHNL